LYPRGVCFVDDHIYIASYDGNMIFRTKAYEFNELEAVAGNGANVGLIEGKALSSIVPRPMSIFPGLHGSIYITSFTHELIIELKNGILAAMRPLHYKSNPKKEYRFYMVRGGFLDEKTGMMYVPEFGNDLIQIVSPDGLTESIGNRVEGHADGTFETCSFDGATQAIPAEPGFLLASERRMVRLVDLERRYVSTYAGVLRAEHVDGPREQASFLFIRSLQYVDGTVFLSDEGHASIRMIDRHGMVTTLFVLSSVAASVASSITFTSLGHMIFSHPITNSIGMLKHLTEPQHVRQVRKAPFSLSALSHLVSLSSSSSSTSSHSNNGLTPSEHDVLAIGPHLRLFVPFLRVAYPSLLTCDHSPLLSFCDSPTHCDILYSIIYAEEVVPDTPRYSLVALHVRALSPLHVTPSNLFSLPRSIDERPTIRI